MHTETSCVDIEGRCTSTAADVTEFDKWPKFATHKPNGCSKLCLILVPSASTANVDRCKSTVAPTHWALSCCSDKAQVGLGYCVYVILSTYSASLNCCMLSAQELRAVAEEA